MSAHGELITALAALCARADLQDWQTIASLQQHWQLLAEAAEAEGIAALAEVALAGATALEALFTTDVATSVVAAAQQQQCALAEQARVCAGSGEILATDIMPNADDGPADDPTPINVSPAVSGLDPVSASSPAAVSTTAAAASPATAVSSAAGAAHSDAALGAAVVLPAQAEAAMLMEFATEAGEHMQAIEANLLAIEATSDPEAVNACFRAFHTVKGLAGFMGLTREQKLAHACENLLDQVRAKRVPTNRQVLDLLLQGGDMLTQFVAACSGAGPGMTLPGEPRLPTLIAALDACAEGKAVRVPSVGELLVQTGKLTRAQLEGALIRQHEDRPDRKLGEVLVEDGKVSAGDVQQALEQQQQVRQTVGNAAASVAPATMRVDVSTVDALADTIGELVIATNMLFHADELKAMGNRRVQTLIAQLDRVTRQVQGMTQRLRLVSVKPVFQRMTRLVRDLERKTGKDVELILEGEDVDMDKAVVDRLADPLVHLVRNAMDHGLEDAATRTAAGKPAKGRLRLAAVRRAGAIHVVIEEDGRGMNRPRILSKAIERGLIKADAELTDSDVWDLIYLPGFSTADKVTDLSGRGVGMDVVRRMVAESRGRILTESRPGFGTTFTLVLPLTLAIIDGMVVKAGRQHFIIPTLSVVLAVRLHADNLTSVHGGRGRLMDHMGRQLPIFNLARLLGVPGDQPARPLAVVINDGSRDLGLEIDAVLGRQQVVLKALGRGLPPAVGVSGATITGDGLVCLVLDINALTSLTTESLPADYPAIHA